MAILNMVSLAMRYVLYIIIIAIVVKIFYDRFISKKKSAILKHISDKASEKAAEIMLVRNENKNKQKN